MTTWRELVRENRVKKHKTSLEEIDGLRHLIRRDLKDASLEALSDDRRFATAYNAVLQTAKMAIAVAGYRVGGFGHHQATFEALELAMGVRVYPYSAYFDTCRRKRNTIDYDAAFVATKTEADELLVKAEEFLEVVEKWIREFRPELAE